MIERVLYLQLPTLGINVEALGINVEGSVVVGPAEEVANLIAVICVGGLERISQMGPSGRIFVERFGSAEVSCW